MAASFSGAAPPAAGTGRWVRTERGVSEAKYREVLEEDDSSPLNDSQGDTGLASGQVSDCPC